MERYQVTFTYAEPTYAQARGIEPRSYRGVFEVTAVGPDAAIALATALFHDAQRQSGVSWVREITHTSWRMLGVDLATA